MISLAKFLGIAFVSFGLAGTSGADCHPACNGSGGGNCSGVSGNFEISCGGTRCSWSIEVFGNGGIQGKNQGEVSASGSGSVYACTGEPSCCMEVMPCNGFDWSDVSSSCANLCVNCYE